MKIRFVFIVLLAGLTFVGNAQEFIQKVELKTNSQSFLSDTPIVPNLKSNQVAFFYEKPNQTVQLYFYFKNNLPDSLQIRRLKLVSSADYEIIDSLLYQGAFYSLKIRFKDLNKSELLSLSLKVFSEGKVPKIERVEFFPLTLTEASLDPELGEFFIGEEKVVRLNSNLAGNIQLVPQWVTANGYDYLVSGKEGEVMLHVMPTTRGKIGLNPGLKSIQPNLVDGKLSHEVSFKLMEIQVKESRVSYLGVSERDFTLNSFASKEGLEVQMDDHRSLKMNKTYRIENKESSGGYLIGEMFTKNSLSNGKVMCQLRLYNLHKQSSGYLYIKDGDEVKFMTNFDVTPATEISQILILHKGGDWTSSLDVYPGETVLVKIKGVGLEKASFKFRDVLFFENDTIIQSDKSKFFTIQVPINIAVKHVEILNYSENTDFSLRVKEHKRPKEFDFININYGDGDKIASTLNQPIMYDKVIQDVLISFNPNRVDTDKELFGEQHFSMDIKVTTKDNQLVDQREIKNIIVCPGSRSPRSKFYKHELATIGEINLNNYLRKKTYDLQDWSRIEIDIEHISEVYGAKGYSQHIELIYQRRTEFDIDVSFPAGLLVHKEGEAGVGNFGGISMAMMAQFSFFHPHKIARYRPYKIGAGFLALNAFNYSNNSKIDRDVGLVIIGSVYPMGSKGKLTFPLFIGGGYFLAQGQWFTLLGPGIRVSF